MPSDAATAGAEVSQQSISLEDAARISNRIRGGARGSHISGSILVVK